MAMHPTPEGGPGGGGEGAVMPREASLGRTMVELADSLVDDFDVVEVLTLLSDRCVEILDVTAAGIVLASPGGNLAVMASSSEESRLLELFEVQTAEGPCLDCYRSGEPVVNQDLAGAEDRWPRFAPRAVAAGFSSVHALPMHLRAATIGALNLFRSGTGSLDDADTDAAQALADIATIAILNNRATLETQAVNTQLSRALNSRIAIEQAKGMIAEQRQVSLGEAFSSPPLRPHAQPAPR
jgi:GAF domain-containing protein